MFCKNCDALTIWIHYPDGTKKLVHHWSENARCHPHDPTDNLSVTLQCSLCKEMLHMDDEEVHAHLTTCTGKKS